MSLRFWLRSLRAHFALSKTARRLKTDAPRAMQLAEALEPRCLLAVTPLVVNGTELIVQLETNDNVVIQSGSAGQLEVLSSSSVVIGNPNILTANITSITVNGGDGSNRIDLTGVTTADFDAALTITVNGGDGNDTILGSEFADSLFGGNGNDSIDGGLGADSINGGNGADVLNGGADNDSLLGGDGADLIHGDAGNDTVNAGNGADQVFGDDGLDSLFGGDGRDTISGDAGDDVIIGDNGNDSLLGGDGNDLIAGGLGNDTASGGDGLDTLSGDGDNDSLNGDAGTDSINGGSGDDALNGGDEADTLNGSAGNDTAVGGAGNDSLVGGTGNDLMSGGLDNDTVLGQTGNDTLFGGGGVDSVDGGAGSDLLQSLGSGVSIVTSASVSEGDTGTTTATLTVTLTEASLQTIRVSFNTENGTALAGSDYVAKSGQLTFAPGVTTQSIVVPIVGDTLSEGAETFRVLLSNPQNSLVEQAVCDVSIVDNEAVTLQSTAASGREGWHGLITLTRTPSQQESLVLERHGIVRQEFLANNVAYGFIANDANLNHPDLKTLVKFVTPLLPEDKIEPDLLDGNFDHFALPISEAADVNYVLGNDGRLKVAVSFARDVAVSVAKSILTSVTSTFTAINDYLWQAQIPHDGLLPLARHDEVAWISAGFAPAVTENDNTRPFVGADAVQLATINGAAGTIIYAGLTGSGVTVGVHDAGVDVTHPDLLVVADTPASDQHGTHVAGIIAASGGASATNGGTPFQWRGMAPRAGIIDSQDLVTASAVLTAIQSSSMDVTNTSLFVSADGNYSAANLAIDQLIRGGAVSGGVPVPRRPKIYSAGNNGAFAGTGNQSGYFSTTKQMKNAMYIGNWDLASNDLAASSSMGPTYDGRIKPDVVAPGSAIRSTDVGGGYTVLNGTSMASPVVTGVHALMLEAWSTTYSVPAGTTIDANPPLPSTLRAIIIHTSDDIINADVRSGTLTDIDSDNNPANGNDGLGRATATAGPDFSTGWGMVNALSATTLVADSRVGGATPVPDRIIESTISSLATIDQQFLVDQAFINSGNPLKITLAWDDIEAAVQSPATSPLLVNDLDLELVAPDGTIFYPWQLGHTILDASGNPLADNAQPAGTPIQVQLGIQPTLTPSTNSDYIPASALTGNGVWVARRGKDHLNNVEQVLVDNVQLQAGVWTVRVIGFNVASGSQDYSLAADVSLEAPTTPPTPPTPVGDVEGDTLTGGDGNDTIVGSNGDDFINGMGGNDSLGGGAGNDSILGGSGGDSLDGGLGDDTVDGQGGNDLVAGGDGSDMYVWNGVGDGKDTLSSLSGYDSVFVKGTSVANNYVVSQNNGQLTISDGSAVLSVSPVIQVVTISAGGGNDTITINALDRVKTATFLTVDGGNGNDLINSNGANVGFVRVSLIGGTGDDTLVGSGGIDSLNGGDGDDSLDAQGGDDLISGGLGDDTILAGAGNDRVFAGDGDDVINAGAGDDSVVGDVGADTISGSDGHDTLDGGDGADVIDGGDGNDSILGGNEADNLNGSLGNDTIRGGASDDTISGENGTDKLYGDDGNDSIQGFDGDDTLNGGDGDDTLDGGAGFDLISGGNGDDILNGSADNDTLTGGDGNDTIAGGAGQDILLGDEGDDSLNGQGSTDIINPGEGSDTIVGSGDVVDTTFVLSAALLAALA